MRRLQPLWLACALLTTLPVSQWIRMPVTPVASGRSVACYPVVGLLLGGLLALVAWALDSVSPLLAAALLLAIWIGLTGALHLDGLADAADAWFAGHADPARTLTVMKDPAAGPMAVASLIVVLLLKFAALATLAAATPVTVLVAAIVARAAAAGFMAAGRYVRPHGIASTQTASLPKPAVWLATFLSALCALALLCVLSWLVALAVAAVVLVFVVAWRAAWQRRIGGYTGDIVGGLIECVETLVLVIAALGVSVGMGSL